RTADRIVRALAVALHETLHATGPRAQADFGTAPGRALEEGLAEAATADLVRGLVRSMGGPPGGALALRRAAVGYRRVYGPQVRWVRSLSRRAARDPAAWRVDAADRWGDDRWERLAAATGSSVAALRSDVPPVADGVPRR